MKLKILAVLCLAVFLFLVGCRGKNDANTNINSNLNSNINTATPTPVTKTNESATMDAATKTKVEAALKAKGFNDITVDTTTSPKATLRGIVPTKEKMAEAVQIAQEASGKPFENQITVKK